MNNQQFKKINMTTSSYCPKCNSVLELSSRYQHYIGDQAYIICPNCEDLIDCADIVFKNHKETSNWNGFEPYD